MKLKHSVALPLFLLLLTSPIVKALYHFDFHYLDMMFWPLTALLLVLSLRTITTKSLDTFMSFLLFYSLATNAIEVLLFIAFGRLPEQAYPHSIIVRFGAWLDAPNDFACILFLLMGWAFYRYQGTRRVLVEGSLIICLILTQSLTAYVFFIMVLIASGIRHAVKHLRSILWLSLVVILVFLLAWWSNIPDLVNTLMISKSGSINGHMFSLKEFFTDWSSWLFLGTPLYQFYEDWWASALVNFGVVWCGLCFVALAGLLLSVATRFKHSIERTDKAVLSGFTLFSVYCVIGSVNLPLLMLFPVGYLFYVFCFLVFFEKLESGDANGNMPTA
jgi:hypothetical protein